MNTKFKSPIFFFFFFLLLTSPTFAKKDDGPSDIKIPTSNLTIKIRSKSFGEQGILNERHVEVDENKSLSRLTWLNISKEQVEGRYPTYRIAAKKGVVEFKEKIGKQAFFHPVFWPQNYVLLGESLPLWLAPEYLDLGRRKSKAFSLGLLKSKPLAMKGLGPQVYQEILYFRNLYEHYEKEGFRGSTLKKFQKEFFEVEFLRHTGTHVVINGESHDLPTQVIGNRYYEMTVLDQPDNPLILKLEFFPKKAPSVFKRSFDYLAENFEFRITQIRF